MLTGDLALCWRRGSTAGPRYIDAEDSEFLQVAEDLIELFRAHRGRPRFELAEAFTDYVGEGTDYKILRGLIKLLTDRCLFETSTSVDPAEVRRALFLRASLEHPVDDPTRHRIIEAVASELGCSAEAVAGGFYGDLSDNQLLTTFEELTPRQLLDEYNLAQAQALLYRCIEMQIHARPQETPSYRQLFDSIKYYRLIHAISGSAASGYKIRLSGPVSIFHRSQKYGVQMAVFLPALLACRDWSMRAEIDFKTRGSAFFELDSSQTRLRSPGAAEAGSDSPLAERLIARWRGLTTSWSLERSRQVVDLGGSVFIPDLVFSHPESKEVYGEILGFWTPRYMAERLKQFEQSGFNNYLLMASEELCGSRDALKKPPANVILYKSSLDPKDVNARLGQLFT